MNQNDRWCVRVCSAIEVEVYNGIRSLGYPSMVACEWVPLKQYWLYWNLKTVMGCEFLPSAYGLEPIKELHPCNLFDGTLEPFKREERVGTTMIVYSISTLEEKVKRLEDSVMELKNKIGETK